MFSVLILTKNEEVNIAECIRACDCSDDIHVFDSYSTDRTTEIARNLGAHIHQRQFDNYGSQREAARLIGYKYPWVLAIDADERPDDELIGELQSISVSPVAHVAFRMRRKDHFLGKWIKHSTLYPSWFIRFYQPDRIQYRPRAVHEYPEPDGSVGELHGHLHHYSFSKGLDEWFVKHVHYARLEAQENINAMRNVSGVFRKRDLIALDPIIRRKALKRLSYGLPFRPTLRFLYSYLIYGGFLDGLPGYYYARMLAIYEEMIVLNIRDLNRS